MLLPAAVYPWLVSNPYTAVLIPSSTHGAAQEGKVGVQFSHVKREQNGIYP